MATKKKSPCKTVAKGSVGESGANTLLHHQVGGKIAKMMVLRTTESDLCPNTGAGAALFVNGQPEAVGDITKVGSSIQAEAGPSDHVVAIVHTIPLFNEIACKRLGNLHVDLDECDLVGFTTAPTTHTGCILPCEGVCTRDWYAWNNKMPPKPDDFHIVGEVEVPNPGVDVELVPRVPQGINPKILLMNLVLVQRPGIWPQVVTWKQARYDKVMADADYQQVQIFCGNDVLADIEVETVH